MHNLLKTLEAGELIIYPTETLYGLGCDATKEKACALVADIKGRAGSKPLPLIIGSMEMLNLVSNEISSSLLNLAKNFWPGPLSILVKAAPELPSLLSDEDGYTSVRWSGHPFAAELSRRLKKPLVSTSANFSGKPPVALPEDLDPELIDKVGAIYLDPPWPKGDKPSTVVRLIGSSQVEVLRQGAVTVTKLCEKGFTVSVK
ncbi:L-threonylcarbamoyladenylate synthase [Pseudodesulfovibrio sediminis]|uniref:L-threonylcarbamoyladenylate synthase n=1 Tax=Pseudodesulfovibrio sediminis TaxID=2810563 RepID=A0ABM7P9G4_9BACT|nr:L-threonylcarbamoyladenylate synthase [Pseudodesulfovibrio sediminis]BCS90213.1 threonylcarbamoyl-AMP synthase [Pseudodesulfovibrio sediminis]